MADRGKRKEEIATDCVERLTHEALILRATTARARKAATGLSTALERLKDDLMDGRDPPRLET